MVIVPSNCSRWLFFTFLVFLFLKTYNVYGCNETRQSLCNAQLEPLTVAKGKSLESACSDLLFETLWMCSNGLGNQSFTFVQEDGFHILRRPDIPLVFVTVVSQLWRLTFVRNQKSTTVIADNSLCQGRKCVQSSLFTLLSNYSNVHTVIVYHKPKCADHTHECSYLPWNLHKPLIGWMLKGST